jgi:signal transduction histidine kinase
MRGSSLLKNLLRKLMYGTWGAAPSDVYKKIHYRRIWISSVFITGVVAIAPLVFMTVVNIHQYHKTIKEEAMHPTSRLVSSNKRALEHSLIERKNALQFIANEKSTEQLADTQILRSIIDNLNSTFEHFVDLTFIDEQGNVINYVGPARYESKLRGVNYSQAGWFQEVRDEGAHISDVFPGFRETPHFVIAVRHRDPHGDMHVLRATLDMELLTSKIPSFSKDDGTDAFIINEKGVLQTASRFGRKALEKAPVPVPPKMAATEVLEKTDDSGRAYVLGYAYIEDTPFIFIMTRPLPELMQSWLSLRGTLLGFLAGSIVVILLLTTAVSSVLVGRIRDADMHHEMALHKVEYTSKMASIGRLAAGVAHEINNPLAIINEKAGLLHDFVDMTPEFPKRDKSLKLIESIIASVERGSAITHRLLGFARHIDVKIQPIDLPALINEVLGFLEKEAVFRNIEVQTFIADGVPSIMSDRGQLQQVFLNLINNAFEALKKDGRVGILIENKDPDLVVVTISDNGPGIPEEDLGHIFEPFFTTKTEGTGLGLAITYGIVRKLRGEIEVESQEGRGTSFHVVLPRIRGD